MSAPISGFSKLSISQMQSSRTHSKGKGKATKPEDDSSSSDEHSEEDVEEGSDSSDEDIDDNIDSVYTHSVFAIDHCRNIGTHYAFQMAYAPVERYSIRISAADLTQPTCSCRVPDCQHIDWLLSQLSHLQREPFAGVALTPYEQISGYGLNAVCEELHWELREGANSDAEETQWQLQKDYSSVSSRRQTRNMIKHRMRIVRDILATMSPVVYSEYRGDIFDADDDLSSDNIFTQGDLEATISRILIFDDQIFHKFRYLVSQDVCASDYFTKMAQKAKETCERLDIFCEIGPQASGGYDDLIWCAQTLVDIVTAISSNVTRRQPLTPSSREAAAKALVFILGMVVRERNHDAYQNPHLTRRRPHGEPQIDRNLYLRLIGDPRSSLADGNFVIKALQDLPEALRFVEDLEDILRRLSSVGWAAPQAYRDRLNTLILKLKSGSANPSPPGTASGKRQAGSLDREANKRMK